MRLKNTTDLPNHFLRRMVGWCCKQIGLPAKQVRLATFANWRAPRGSAWYHNILIRVDKKRADLRAHRYGGYDYPAMDWMGGLVCIVGHELGHLLLWHTGRDDRNREGMCGYYGVQCLRAFQANRESLLAAWNVEPVKRIKEAVPLADQRYAKCLADLARWERKAKLAKTKIRKLTVRRRYYERKQAAMKGV